MSESTRFNNKEFGSVFKAGGWGGPRTNELIQGSTRLPGWPDKRYPGNMNPLETSNEIMKKWDNQQMKRFQHFMDQYYIGMTPWKLQYMDRTAPDYRKQETDIIKCKIELIKRLLKIKLCGAESMEDWCLLFLYYDNHLDLPQNIEEMIRPSSGEMRPLDFINTEYKTKYRPMDYVITPAVNAVDHSANPPLFGFGTSKRRPENIPNMGIVTNSNGYRGMAFANGNIEYKTLKFPRYTTPDVTNDSERFTILRPRPNLNT
jgi:hypothetical protein